MFASLATVSTLFLAAASLVSAHPTAHSELARRVNIVARGKPAGWPDAALENYDVYHARYNALACSGKHGDKKFFNSCCTPMNAGQKLSSRPAECSPKPATNPTKPPTKPSTPVKSSDDDDNSGAPVNKGGKATFFFQNGQPGACGKRNPDSLPLVALDTRRYGNTSRKSSDCGRHVRIKNIKNGKTVVAIIADACPTCANSNSLDLSTGAFDAIGDRDTGVLSIEWSFV